LTDCAVADEFDPCAEDVCGPNHLPGYEHVEELSKILVDIALEEGKLAISSFTRQSLIAAWNKLHLHDRSIQQFDSLYAARWGNTLFGRTNGDPSESSLVQKLKFSKRYSAAHLLDSRKNHLMYCVVKQLWLHPDCRAKANRSPLTQHLTKLYQRAQQRVTVDDAELSKLGIPLLKMNTKSIRDFIRRQEALSATNVTDQGASVLRRHQSVGQCNLPPARELPLERPHTSRPQVTYEVTPSLAGTRSLKYRKRNNPVESLFPHSHPAPPPVTSAQSTPGTCTVASPFPHSHPAPPPVTQSTPSTCTVAPPFPNPNPEASVTLAQATPFTAFVLPPQCTLIQFGAARPSLPLLLPQTGCVTTSTARLRPIASSSTIYKRKRAQRSGEHSGANANAFKTYVCALCGQPTQGHKKYRKKTYCQNTKSSSSTGLVGQSFETFADFQRAVDLLLGTSGH
ncbi:unnamed protein product, partial [Tetraodon nigroviridis]